MSGKETSNAKPERRAQPRHAEPALAVTVAGKIFETDNWSMSGMVLADYDGPLSVGSIFTIATLGRAGGKEKPTEVQVSARVTRKDSGALAFNFLEVDGTAFTLLQGWMAERMDILNQKTTNY